MKLKDAFRYKAKLNEWLENINISFADTGKYAVTEIHLKHSVVPSERDETIDVTPNPGGLNAAQAYDFARVLLSEYAAVSQAIDSSMSLFAPDYKSTLDTARAMRNVAAAFQKLSAAAVTEIRTTGTATFVNEAGVACTYSYPVITRREPLLDPRKAAEAARRLLTQADERSAIIDEHLVTTDVRFDPQFNVNDTYLTAARSAGILD